MRLIRILSGVLVAVLFVGLGFLMWRDFKSNRSPNHTLFRQGAVPKPLPDGPHKGTVVGYDGDWIGKTFDAKTATGKNLLKAGSGIEERYPFVTAVGRGIADPNTVVKIDYNIAGNPLWLRAILDEIVEVGPNHYLGKIHVRVGPVHFAVGYFELRK